MALSLRSFFPMLLPFAALLLGGCAMDASEEALTTSTEEIASSTRLLLEPVNESVRVTCRKEWASYYCTAAEANAAIARCETKMHEAGLKCPSTGCVRKDVRSQSCSAPAPVYATAQSCNKPIDRTCQFYASCTEPAISCGEAGYSLGYGEKYCSAFKNADSRFSTRGKNWRDGVMKCLQEQLVPYTKGQPPVCSKLLEAAFDSHPDCYTRPAHNICTLPPSDILTVFSVIQSGGDLFTTSSSKQMTATARKCVAHIRNWLGASSTATGTSGATSAAEAQRDMSIIVGEEVLAVRELENSLKIFEDISSSEEQR